MSELDVIDAALDSGVCGVIPVPRLQNNFGVAKTDGELVDSDAEFGRKTHEGEDGS